MASWILSNIVQTPQIDYEILATLPKTAQTHLLELTVPTIIGRARRKTQSLSLYKFFAEVYERTIVWSYTCNLGWTQSVRCSHIKIRTKDDTVT